MLATFLKMFEVFLAENLQYLVTLIQKNFLKWTEGMKFSEGNEFKNFEFKKVVKKSKSALNSQKPPKNNKII
jgi:hypothetical protein